MSWLKKKKKYSKPRKLYDKVRIEEENELIEKYGLKNKKEIWKADAAIEKIRKKAKKLITASQEEKKKLLDKLNKIGIMVEKIADVLALNKENWLKRRLQSLLIEKKLAKPKEARQLISHKHVLVNDKIVNIPSYIVKINEENKIKLKKVEKAKGLEIKKGKKEGEEETIERKEKND